MENKTVGNPKDFVYENGVKVEVDGFLITDLIAIFEKLVNDEIKPESEFKYNFVNEKGKIVKSPKQSDLDTGKVKKVVDFERTILKPIQEELDQHSSLSFIYDLVYDIDTLKVGRKPLIGVKIYLKENKIRQLKMFQG